MAMGTRGAVVTQGTCVRIYAHRVTCDHAFSVMQYTSTSCCPFPYIASLICHPGYLEDIHGYPQLTRQSTLFSLVYIMVNTRSTLGAYGDLALIINQL